MRTKGKEDQDGHGLPWLASSKLQSLQHSSNFLQVTLTSLCLLPMLSSWRSHPRKAVKWRARTPLPQTLRMKKKTLQVSEVASPVFGLEVHCNWVPCQMTHTLSVHPTALMVQQKAGKVLYTVLHPRFGSHGNRWEGGTSTAGSIGSLQGCFVKDTTEDNARCPDHPCFADIWASCSALPGAPAGSTGSLLPSNLISVQLWRVEKASFTKPEVHSSSPIPSFIL